MNRSRPLLCGALLLFTGSRTSWAAETDARPADRQVDLIVGATPSELQLVEPPIRDMLEGKGLRVTTTRTAKVTAPDVAAALAPPTGATMTVARVLLDFTMASQATLFLIDPRRGRVYVRRMALEHGLDAVARAGARFVIEQSVDAILEGREIGVTREEYQRSVVPPPPAKEAPPLLVAPPSTPALQPVSEPQPSAKQLLLAAGYEGLALGAGANAHAAKVVVAVRLMHLQLAAAARLAAPIAIVGDGVQARLTTGGVGVSAAAAFVPFQNLSLMAGVGVGLDMTRVEPTVMTPDLQPAGAFWARGPLLQPFGEIERRFGRISVAIAIGAEVHLLDERYTVRIGNETRDVFVPRRLRPAAALLVGVLF